MNKLAAIDSNQVPVAQHFYPCTSSSGIAYPIVLLHGWGSASETWQPLLPALQKLGDLIALDLPGFGESKSVEEFSLESVCALIAAQLPEKCLLIGWSLGGMLAVNLAAQHPQKICGLVTLAANAKFVASRDYESAMPLTVSRQFNKSFARDAEATLKLFGGLLAQGDNGERALLKKIRAASVAEPINANWLQALQLLSTLDNRAAFAQLAQPGLHLLAEKDALVPVSAATSLRELNKHQRVVELSGVAHALHWSQPEKVAQHISEFIKKSFGVAPAVIDKQKIASSFSRAAATYDSVAQLQRDVGESLLQYLDRNHGASLVLDLGCGTGHFTDKLQLQFPTATVVGLDLAEGMLQFARNRHASGFEWLCGDAEHLPLADASVDIIFSSLALQWCADLSGLFAELARVLKPGGQLVFSSLGPRTLHEIKSAWHQVDDYVHVNPFFSPEQLQISLGDFFVQTFLRNEYVLQFESLTELTRSIKALGAHNMNPGRAPGLGGRQKMVAFKQAYESFRAQGLLPATYDVYLIAATKKEF